MMADKVQENRIRRMAQRQGMSVEKVRRIDPKALDYGKLRLLDAKGQIVRFGESEFGTADEIEAHLRG